MNTRHWLTMITCYRWTPLIGWHWSRVTDERPSLVDIDHVLATNACDWLTFNPGMWATSARRQNQGQTSIYIYSTWCFWKQQSGSANAAVPERCFLALFPLRREDRTERLEIESIHDLQSTSKRFQYCYYWIGLPTDWQFLCRWPSLPLQFGFSKSSFDLQFSFTSLPFKTEFIY